MCIGFELTCVDAYEYEGKAISGKFSCSTASHLIYYTDDNNCRLINAADGKWDLAIKASGATTFTTIAHLDGWNDGELGINLAVKNDGQFSEVNFKNSPYYIAIDAGFAPGDTYLYGGSKEDSIRGSSFKDIINTGGGNSFVMSYSGNDFITCGNGNDFVMSGPGIDSSNDNDVVSGGVGTDIIFSGGGDDILYATDKDADFESESSLSGKKGDWLTAGSGSDLLFGSDSQDVLLGGGNDDIIRGGAGNDLIFGDANVLPSAQVGPGPSGTAGWISKAWSVQYNGFIDADKSQFGLTVVSGQTFSWQWKVLDSGDVSVSNLGYTTFADGRFSQNSGDDVLDGGNGDDWIAGQAGNDTLYGGEGDDILYGDDAVVLGFSAIDGNDKIHAGAGKDKLFGGGGNDILWATEDDKVVDIIQGGEGNDSLFGGSGADQLDGGAGDDDLHAGSDGSSLVGGAGADLLIGGLGNDKLDGGIDSDYFITSAGTDSLTDYEGNDYYQINSKDFVAASAKTVITDGDGKGLLHLDNDVIEGKALTATSKTTWKANSGAYTLELKAGSLFISMKDAAGSVEIKNFVNSKDGYLGLVLPEYSEQPDPQVNHAPVLAAPLPDKTAKEDKAFKFVLPAGTFTDSDSGDSLSLSATLSNGKALPTWLKFNAKTRTFIGTPDNDQVGAIAIRVTATDKAGAKASDVFKVTVQNTNDAPEVATALPEKQDAKEGALFKYVAPLNEVFKDVDKGDVLTYSSTLADGSALPAWLRFDAATGTFSGTPVTGSAGLLGLVVTATDKEGASVSNGFSLNIGGTINVLKGTSDNDTLKGSEGQDKIYGYDGDDTLYGRGGDDALSGSNGNDRLDGGAGNDDLFGGAGNDTYFFGKGYGQDLISDTDATFYNLDRLLFKSGIATDQLWFKNSNNNLEVSIIGTSDTVTIKNWFTNSNAHIEQLKTADGKTLLDTQVANLVNAMATLTPPAAGETSLSTAYHNKLDVVIAANWK